MRRIFSLLLILACTQASLAQLSGPLSGTLGPGQFHVIDTIYVNEGDSLRLLPGTTFLFDGGWPFLIHGTLLADGTETDSVVFTTESEISPWVWGSLIFDQSASSGSRLSYCAIRRSCNWDGGGIRCDQSSPTFMNCTISENWAYGSGGGVYCLNNSSPVFIDCDIRNNSASGEWFCGYGGGVYCSHSSPTFSGCTICDNIATWTSGGLECYESSLTLMSCLISHNHAIAGYTGGVLCINCSGTITNCTISDNDGDGAFVSGSPVVFNSVIIAFSRGEGILFRNSELTVVEYCDVFGNSGGNIGFWLDDPSHGPESIGELAAANANGDSCDTYYNIFLDPMFVDAAADNYHLLEGSPCIDAGDPELPLDPDSTIADIGAFYFHQLDARNLVAALPVTHSLHPNWPNPFNPITNIRYDVPQTGNIRLIIYNLLGQEVTRLVDKRHLPGSYTVSWNAANSPSGLYLCRMEAERFAQVRKLLLVK